MCCEGGGEFFCGPQFHLPERFKEGPAGLFATPIDIDERLPQPKSLGRTSSGTQT